MGGARVVWSGAGIVVATIVAAIIATTGSGGCPAYPAFPNAGCTGVPAGTSLVARSGNMLIKPTDTTTTVSGVNVEDCIIIQKTGVTIENSRAACILIEFATPAYDVTNPPIVIRDTEINCGQSLGTNPGNSGIAGQNYTATRVDVTDCENGFDAGANVTITDSFIHDLYNSAVGDPHTDGIQVYDGDGLTIEHSTFYAFSDGCTYPNSTGSCNGSSALGINNDPNESDPPVANVLIEHNLIAGGGYSLYCPRVATTNFHVTDNHFSTVYSPNVGEYAASVDCTGSGGEVLSGNVIHETGLPAVMF